MSERGRELTRPPYLFEPLERFYPEAMAPAGLTGRATYRSPWPRSSFCLVADGSSDVTLDLTVRLPAVEGAAEKRRGEVRVEVDRRTVGSVAAGETWRRESIRVPRAVLRPAIHRVTIVWPPLPACGDAALEAAVRRLENGVEADLHPVFGEVFSLRARRRA